MPSTTTTTTTRTTPQAQVFAAVQDWQLGTGSSDTAAHLALTLTAGDEPAALALLQEAARLWGLVVDSAAQPFTSGEDGSEIGAAHGRPRYSSWTRP